MILTFDFLTLNVFCVSAFTWSYLITIFNELEQSAAEILQFKYVDFGAIPTLVFSKGHAQNCTKFWEDIVQSSMHTKFKKISDTLVRSVSKGGRLKRKCARKSRQHFLIPAKIGEWLRYLRGKIKYILRWTSGMRQLRRLTERRPRKHIKVQQQNLRSSDIRQAY